MSVPFVLSGGAGLRRDPRGDLARTGRAGHPAERDRRRHVGRRAQRRGPGVPGLRRGDRRRAQHAVGWRRSAARCSPSRRSPGRWGYSVPAPTWCPSAPSRIGCRSGVTIVPPESPVDVRPTNFSRHLARRRGASGRLAGRWLPNSISEPCGRWRAEPPRRTHRARGDLAPSRIAGAPGTTAAKGGHPAQSPPDRRL
jgi:hypothetical protein